MDKIHLILFGVIILMFIYFQNKTNNLEKMTATPDIRAAVKEVYKADVQAIKNLGDFASTFMSADKKELTLPFDKVNINGVLNMGGNIALNDKEIRFRGANDGNHYMKWNQANDGPEIKGFAGVKVISPLSVDGLFTANNGSRFNGDRHIFKDKEKSDGNGLRVGAAWGKYGIYAETGDLAIGGQSTVVQMQNGHSIKSTGRLHIAAEDRLYLLPKQGTWLTTDWGANGEIIVPKTSTNDIKTVDGRCLTINHNGTGDKVSVKGSIVLSHAPTDTTNSGYNGHLFLIGNVYANAFDASARKLANTYKCS